MTPETEASAAGHNLGCDLAVAMVVDLGEGEASAVGVVVEPVASTSVDDCIKAVASCIAGMVPHNPSHKDSVAYAVDVAAVVVVGGA